MKIMTPAFRVSIGLMFLTISVLLFADLLNVIPNASKAELESRKKFIETLAIQISYTAQNNDLDTVTDLINSIQERYDDVNSIALRRTSGKLIMNAGNHESHWNLLKGDKSTPDQVRVPIFKGNAPWGTVEMSFTPLQKSSRFFISITPIVKLFLFVAIIGFFVFWLFMKKTLQHLDPSAVIPDRVKLALDALTEGLVLMDEDEQIVLANSAFSKISGKSSEELLGKKVSALDWSIKRKTDENLIFPWQKTLQGTAQITGKHLKFNTPKGLRTLSINSTPVLDAKGKQRGALATFDDVTNLEEKNFQLTRAMRELKKSKLEIEKTNEKLKQLATTDSLTGCLNRRAFFEIFDEIFEQSSEKELCCIMLPQDPVHDRVLILVQYSIHFQSLKIFLFHQNE